MRARNEEMAGCLPFFCGSAQPYPFMLISSYYQRISRSDVLVAAKADVSKLARYCVDSPSTVPQISAAIERRVQKDVRQPTSKLGHLLLALRICSEVVVSMHVGNTAEVSILRIFEDATLRVAASILTQSAEHASVTMPACGLVSTVLTHRLSITRSNDTAGLSTAEVEALLKPLTAVLERAAFGPILDRIHGGPAWRALGSAVSATAVRRVSTVMLPILPRLFHLLRHCMQSQESSLPCTVAMSASAHSACAVLRLVSQRLSGAGSEAVIMDAALSYLDAYGWRPMAFSVALIRALDGATPLLPPSNPMLDSPLSHMPMDQMTRFPCQPMPLIILQHLDKVEDKFEMHVGNATIVRSGAQEYANSSGLSRTSASLLQSVWENSIAFDPPLYGALHGPPGAAPDIPWWLIASPVSLSRMASGAGSVSIPPPAASASACAELYALREGMVGACLASLDCMDKVKASVSSADMIDSIIPSLVEMAASARAATVTPAGEDLFSATAQRIQIMCANFVRLAISTGNSMQEGLQLCGRLALAYGQLFAHSVVEHADSGRPTLARAPSSRLSPLRATRSFRAASIESGRGPEEAAASKSSIIQHSMARHSEASRATLACASSCLLQLVHGIVSSLVAPSMRLKGEQTGAAPRTGHISRVLVPCELTIPLEIALYDECEQVVTSSVATWRVLLEGTRGWTSTGGQVGLALPEQCIPRLWQAALFLGRSGASTAFADLTSCLLDASAPASLLTAFVVGIHLRREQSPGLCGDKLLNLVWATAEMGPFSPEPLASASARTSEAYPQEGKFLAVSLVDCPALMRVWKVLGLYNPSTNVTGEQLAALDSQLSLCSHEQTGQILLFTRPGGCGIRLDFRAKVLADAAMSISTDSTQTSVAAAISWEDSRRIIVTTLVAPLPQIPVPHSAVQLSLPFDLLTRDDGGDWTISLFPHQANVDDLKLEGRRFGPADGRPHDGQHCADVSLFGAYGTGPGARHTGVDEVHTVDLSGDSAALGLSPRVAALVSDQHLGMLSSSVLAWRHSHREGISDSAVQHERSAAACAVLAKPAQAGHRWMLAKRTPSQPLWLAVAT